MKEKGDQKQFTLQEQRWCIYSPLWVREEVFLIVFVLLGVVTNALKCTWKSCLKLLQYGYCMWGKRPATICLASIAEYLGNKHKGALVTSSLTKKKNIRTLGPACSFDLTLQQMYRFDSTWQILKEVCLVSKAKWSYHDWYWPNYHNNDNLTSWFLFENFQLRPILSFSRSHLL